MSDQNSSPSNKIADTNALLEQIKEFIEHEIQPYIRMDGGEMKILSLDDDGTLKVSMHGACHGCPSSMLTLQMGVQRALNNNFPEYDIIVTPVDSAED